MPVTYDPLREGEPTGDQIIDGAFDPFTRAAARTRRSVNRLMRQPVQDDRDPQTVAQVNRLLGQNGNTSSILDVLGGRNGVERVQTLPERIVRSAVTAPHDAMTGELQMVDPATGRTSEKAIERASDLANFAIGGSLPAVALRGAERNVLGSGLVPKEIPKPVEPAPVFYSAVENALEHTTTGAATPEQWMATLKNAKGVKPEELQWLGLDDLMAEKAGQKVTRAELQDWVRNHKIDVQEVNKSDKVTLDAMVDAEMAKYEKEVERRRGRPLTEEERAATREETRREIEANHDVGAFSDVRYPDYQLPGGKDYGELLLTLPEVSTKGTPIEGVRAVKPDGTRLNGAWKDEADARASLAEFMSPRELAEIKFLPDTAESFASRGSPRATNYQSSHWDEPNVLAHVRYNTRDIDGKKTLHLEEIQSDWHQQGKKKGYQGKQEPTPEQIEEKASSYFNQTHKDETHWGKISEEEKNKWREEARAALKDPRTGGGVPDAPFKKTWPELAFKRMLRHAADNGYDAISWTPGVAQAARYDLSKHFNGIAATRLPDGTYHITGKRPGSAQTYETLANRVPTEKLADTVGKDLADKIANQKDHMLHEYNGVDLKVGGEGMMRFYDDQLPVIAAKYGKPYGAKIEQKQLKSGLEITPNDVYATEKDMLSKKKSSGFQVDHPDDPDIPVQWFATRPEAETYVRSQEPVVHYMELPQALREHATRRGYPLFSHGLMLTPVEGNPFEEKK